MKVILALPGRTFSGTFLMNWSQTLMSLTKKGYDFMVTNEQIVELLEDTKKYPVVSGLYRMQDMVHYACVKVWDTDYFKKTGSFKFMKVGELEKEGKYVPVAYNGMGFFACRREVLEKMKYPYFTYPLIEMEGEDGKLLRDTCSEDVAFCKNLKDAGFEVIVNTTLRVGHEKTLVI